MTNCTIYSANGDIIDGDYHSSTADRVKERCISIVRLAVEPQKQRVEMYFRLRETEASRAEQRYAVVDVDPWDVPIQNAADEIKRWVDRHSYELVTDHSSMGVFNTLLDPSLINSPGENDIVNACSHLVHDSRPHTVRVSNSNRAVGLLSATGGGGQSIAITDRASDTGVENVDMTIQVGDATMDVQPVGKTISLWNELAKKYTRLTAVSPQRDAHTSPPSNEESGGFMSNFSR